MHIIDTHTHLYQPAFDGEREAAIARCLEADVKTLLLPNIDRASIDRVHAMMDQWPDHCFGMMGLHPCHVKPREWQIELDAIQTALFHSKRTYVAIGEIGFEHRNQNRKRSQAPKLHSRQHPNSQRPQVARHMGSKIPWKKGTKKAGY